MPNRCKMRRDTDTMRLRIACSWLIRRSYLLFAAVAATFILSCSSRHDIAPPFEPNDGIQAKKILDLQEAPSGMQGSGYAYVVWTLGTNTQNVAEATSTNLVRNNVYWQQGQTNQLNQALGFFVREPAYAQVEPMIVDILAAPDLRFAWESYSSSEKPPYAAVWICSPSLKKIAYLHIY
jgi:hypothetical protein